MFWGHLVFPKQKNRLPLWPGDQASQVCLVRSRCAAVSANSHIKTLWDRCYFFGAKTKPMENCQTHRPQRALATTAALYRPGTEFLSHQVLILLRTHGPRQDLVQRRPAKAPKRRTFRNTKIYPAIFGGACYIVQALK